MGDVSTLRYSKPPRIKVTGSVGKMNYLPAPEQVSTDSQYHGCKACMEEIGQKRVERCDIMQDSHLAMVS